MLHQEVDDAFEKIDAIIFSGDLFHQTENFKIIKSYIDRWQRQFDNIEKNVRNIKIEDWKIIENVVHIDEVDKHLSYSILKIEGEFKCMGKDGKFTYTKEEHDQKTEGFEIVNDDNFEKDEIIAIEDYLEQQKPRFK